MFPHDSEVWRALARRGIQGAEILSERPLQDLKLSRRLMPEARRWRARGLLLLKAGFGEQHIEDVLNALPVKS